MNNNNSKSLDAVLSKYLINKKVIVIDESSSLRMSITKVLCDFGLPRKNVFSTKRFDEAKDYITKEAPEIVICDYKVQDQYGLDLLNHHREYFSDSHKKIFVLMSAIQSEGMVAAAIEEDIDAFILKPISGDQLKNLISKLLITKIRPSDYRLLVYHGKEMYLNGDFAEAIATLEDAKKYDPKPSLACYYQGLAYEEIGENTKALKCYNEGLALNEIHFKCLTAKYELFRKIDNFNESYKTLKHFSNVFPLNSIRLEAAIDLAVKTFNYEDLDRYYNHYLMCEERSNDLRKSMQSTLVIVGKTFLKNGEFSKGVDFLRKYIQVSNRSLDSIEEALNELIAHNLTGDAESILGLAHIEDKSSFLFKSLEFLVRKAEWTIDDIVQNGKKLISEGTNDDRIFSVVIAELLGQNKIVAAENIAYMAVDKFPDKRNEFLKFIS